MTKQTSHGRPGLLREFCICNAPLAKSHLTPGGHFVGALVIHNAESVPSEVVELETPCLLRLCSDWKLVSFFWSIHHHVIIFHFRAFLAKVDQMRNRAPSIELTCRLGSWYPGGLGCVSEEEIMYSM